MKLTKAQRLFIKAGEIYEEIAYCKWVRKVTATSDVASRIRQLKKKRKKLLRVALEAYETEKLVQQASAYERGFCAGRRINETTKTQHTHNKAMTEDEKDMLLANFERLIRQTASMGGYKYEGDCGEYRLTPRGTSQCPEIEAVIYDLVNALGHLESIKTEDEPWT